jgi:hypothetical protein
MKSKQCFHIIILGICIRSNWDILYVGNKNIGFFFFLIFSLASLSRVSTLIITLFFFHLFLILLFNKWGNLLDS